MSFSTRLPAFLILVAVACPGQLSASTILPSFYGQPNTTREGYYFTSSSTTPSANVLENSYGVPVATISVGALSAGWQNPANAVDLSGVNSDGAWDMGKSGTISLTTLFAPAAPPPGSYYRLDFEVYAVAYKGITAMPSFFSTAGTASDLVMQDQLVAVDPMFPGAEWDSRTWTGHFDNLTSNSVSFSLSAPANNSSVIDTYELFTKYTLVPEPSSSLLLLGTGMGWCLRRRRD